MNIFLIFKKHIFLNYLLVLIKNVSHQLITVKICIYILNKRIKNNWLTQKRFIDPIYANKSTQYFNVG